MERAFRTNHSLHVSIVYDRGARSSDTKARDENFPVVYSIRAVPLAANFSRERCGGGFVGAIRDFVCSLDGVSDLQIHDSLENGSHVRDYSACFLRNRVSCDSHSDAARKCNDIASSKCEISERWTRLRCSDNLFVCTPGLLHALHPMIRHERAAHHQFSGGRNPDDDSVADSGISLCRSLYRLDVNCG